MKRIIMLATVALLSVGAFAQNSAGKTKHKSAKKVAVQQDGFKKVNGQMMVVSNGAAEIMIKAQTLANGIMVYPNGALKNTSGETTTLENGDFLDLEGNVKSKDKSEKKWNSPSTEKPVRDSMK